MTTPTRTPLSAPLIEQTMQTAIAHQQAGRLQEAAELYGTVLQQFPKHAEANYNLGAIAAQLNMPTTALPLFVTALEVNPECNRYWISYLETLTQAGQNSEAHRLLALARQNGLRGNDVDAFEQQLNRIAPISPAVQPPSAQPPPQEVDALLALFRAGRIAETEARARTMTQRYPQHGYSWMVLGVALKNQGRSAEAIGPMQQSVALLPNDANAFSNFGGALKDVARLAEAEAMLRRALAINPNHTQALNNLGITLLASQKLTEAEACLRRAIAIDPKMIDAHNNLGNALKALGRSDDAVASYSRAIQLDQHSAEAHYNIGIVMQDLGNLPAAVACFRHALEIRPAFAAALSNLGVSLMRLGQLAEAEESCRRALQLDPTFVAAHVNLGATLMARGRQAEAETCYRQAIHLDPDNVLAHSNLGVALQDLGRPTESVASYRRALSIDPTFVDAHDNLLFTLSLQGGDPAQQNEEIMLAARHYNEQFCLPHRAAWQTHRNSRDPQRRLRIGYVSPDFRRHAVAYFVEPIIARHDHSQVEVFCYGEVASEDDYTARFQQLADHWHSTIGLSDDQMANLIREQQIDILVDLAGHTSKNRLRVFARKPAPLQLTYLGYPGTSGLSTMDYRLTDRFADPEGMTESHYVEQLLRLPDSVYCYRPAIDMPEPTELPALVRGYLTFGSFNNANKIDQRTLQLWAELLRTVSTARLMMLTVPEGELRQRWVQRFAELGIAAQRLEFHGKLPTAEFHRKFLDVDISLDTVSVSGGTTTCESLWMGVPVIAYAGQRFITRVSHSCLSTVGLAEFSAASPEEYVRIAARCTNDIPRLAEIRAGLRERLRTSPLVDEVRFTRNLENLYRDIWRKWCSSN